MVEDRLAAARERASARLKRIGDRGGRCEICNRLAVYLDRNLALDHDHKTDLFRGYLCSQCNLGLGAFKDDPSLLEKAIVYLKAHADKVVRGERVTIAEARKSRRAVIA